MKHSIQNIFFMSMVGIVSSLLMLLFVTTAEADSKSPPSESSSCGTAFDSDCDGVSSNFTYDSGTGTYTRDYDDNDSSVGAYPGS